MGYSQPRRIEERIAYEIWLALVLLAIALIQSALLPHPLGLVLNPLLVLVVCQALVTNPANAARWAFYGGLSLDLCADSLLGSHALALLAAVLLASWTLSRIGRGNWLLPLAGTFLGAIAYNLVLALIWLLLVAPIDPLAYIIVVVLPSTLVALIPALPVFLVMRWWARRRRGEVAIDVY
jgi:rod shape-determining protein MreD